MVDGACRCPDRRTSTAPITLSTRGSDVDAFRALAQSARTVERWECPPRCSPSPVRHRCVPGGAMRMVMASSVVMSNQIHPPSSEQVGRPISNSATGVGRCPGWKVPCRPVIRARSPWTDRRLPRPSRSAPRRTTESRIDQRPPVAGREGVEIRCERNAASGRLQRCPARCVGPTGVVVRLLDVELADVQGLAGSWKDDPDNRLTARFGPGDPVPGRNLAHCRPAFGDCRNGALRRADAKCQDVVVHACALA